MPKGPGGTLAAHHCFRLMHPMLLVTWMTAAARCGLSLPWRKAVAAPRSIFSRLNCLVVPGYVTQHHALCPLLATSCRQMFLSKGQASPIAMRWPVTRVKSEVRESEGNLFQRFSRAGPAPLPDSSQSAFQKEPARLSPSSVLLMR